MDKANVPVKTDRSKRKIRLGWTVAICVLSSLVGGFFGYNGASVATFTLVILLLASLLLLVDYKIEKSGDKIEKSGEEK